MLSRLRSLFRPEPASPAGKVRVLEENPPRVIGHSDHSGLDFLDVLQCHEGLPAPDWRRVMAWLDSGEAHGSIAERWPEIQRAWALHLRQALGPAYEISELGSTLLVSTLPARQRDMLLTFVEKSQQRISRLLHGIARRANGALTLVFVFEDQETYYRYVSRYYPDCGEFALSGGMHINDGCSHFVTARADLTLIEPVIVHELTHAQVTHLPIPAWLNEGLAVNSERRLTPTPAEFTPAEFHAMHAAYWSPETIQDFWSGQAFHASGEENRLAYDLGQLLTAQLSQDWDAFTAFANEATMADSGHAAALAHFDLDLGEAVRLMFDARPDEGWSPRPASWGQLSNA